MRIRSAGFFLVWPQESCNVPWEALEGHLANSAFVSLMARAPTIKCPHCGGKFVYARTQFRQDLVRLADGTRTYGELAELTGSSKASVKSTLCILRKQGMKVKASR